MISRLRRHLRQTHHYEAELRYEVEYCIWPELGPIYTLHFSRVERNSSHRKLAGITWFDYIVIHHGSNVFYFAVCGHCARWFKAISESFSGTCILFDAAEMRRINWALYSLSIYSRRKKYQLIWLVPSRLSCLLLKLTGEARPAEGEFPPVPTTLAFPPKKELIINRRLRDGWGRVSQQPRPQGLSSSRSRGQKDERPWERGWSASWWQNPASETGLSPRFSSTKLLCGICWRDCFRSTHESSRWFLIG